MLQDKVKLHLEIVGTDGPWGETLPSTVTAIAISTPFCPTPCSPVVLEDNAIVQRVSPVVDAGTVVTIQGPCPRCSLQFRPSLLPWGLSPPSSKEGMD